MTFREHDLHPWLEASSRPWHRDPQRGFHSAGKDERQNSTALGHPRHRALSRAWTELKSSHLIK